MAVCHRSANYSGIFLNVQIVTFISTQQVQVILPGSCHSFWESFVSWQQRICCPQNEQTELWKNSELSGLACFICVRKTCGFLGIWRLGVLNGKIEFSWEVHQVHQVTVHQLHLETLFGLEGHSSPDVRSWFVAFWVDSLNLFDMWQCDFLAQRVARCWKSRLSLGPEVVTSPWSCWCATPDFCHFEPRFTFTRNARKVWWCRRTGSRHLNFWQETKGESSSGRQGLTVYPSWNVS